MSESAVGDGITYGNVAGKRPLPVGAQVGHRSNLRSRQLHCVSRRRDSPSEQTGRGGGRMVEGKAGKLERRRRAGTRQEREREDPGNAERKGARERCTLAEKLPYCPHLGIPKEDLIDTHLLPPTPSPGTYGHAPTNTPTPAAARKQLTLVRHRTRGESHPRLFVAP